MNTLSLGTSSDAAADMPAFAHRVAEEGSARLIIPTDSKISRKMPVFYNPLMKLNRDISVLLLKALGRKGMICSSPLAGTGVRELRFLLELEKDALQGILMNDLNPVACSLMKKNLEMNPIGKKYAGQGCEVRISNQEANIFLRQNPLCDYIDIDPFGTPVPFLDSAIVRLQRQGILAVTATDTSSLCGTFPKVCKRRYWATPLHNELMHEVGLRILIRKVQLVGVQHERALTPLFSYSLDHYFRIFFLCEKSKGKCDELLKQHKHLLYDLSTMERSYSSDPSSAKGITSAGPLFAGAFADKSLVKKMLAFSEPSNKKQHDLLTLIHDELDYMDAPFHDIHALVKKYRLGDIPRFDRILAKVKGVRTHFSPTGIRTRSSAKQIADAIRKLNRKRT